MLMESLYVTKANLDQALMRIATQFQKNPDAGLILSVSRTPANSHKWFAKYSSARWFQPQTGFLRSSKKDSGQVQSEYPRSRTPKWSDKDRFATWWSRSFAQSKNDSQLSDWSDKPFHKNRFGGSSKTSFSKKWSKNFTKKR